MNYKYVALSDCNWNTRAYIAASRRSDRSLEARIESARRASEIHKRRTGRALRVTEADVVNEEMYEEEDDDTTHAYRNLGMLIGGNASNIDRRFYAYYAHQMQMKGIVDQMIQQQQQMQLGRTTMAGSEYAQNQMYPGGYMPQQQQTYPFFRQVPHMQPAYRSSPYPMAQSHGRAMSMHIPQNPSMRMPQQAVGINPQTRSSAPISPVSPATNGNNGHLRQMSAPPPNSATSDMKSAYSGDQIFQTSPPRAHQLPSPDSDSESPFTSMFPFTNELPGESARFLQGVRQNDLGMPYNNCDLFDSGTTYTTSKGFTTSRSPLQQNDPFEVKTEDGMATTTGELKWQPSKLDSPFSNANLNASLLTETVNPEDDILNSLFDAVMMPTTSTDRFGALGDYSSADSLSADHTVDQETWDNFVNNDWLDVTTAN
jgi:hypothetical protein